MIGRAINVYIDWTRRHFVPDWVYKIWLRAEMMDAETYRMFQKRGFIDDKTGPDELLERSESVEGHMTEYDPTVCPYCGWWVPEGMEYVMGDHIQQCIEDQWDK